jgi:hypothetical protein
MDKKKQAARALRESLSMQVHQFHSDFPARISIQDIHFAFQTAAIYTICVHSPSFSAFVPRPKALPS